MFRSLLLPAACLLATSAAAAARPIRLVCDVISEPTGKRLSRLVTIDPERHSVQDDALTFQDGATSALGHDVHQFMHLDHGKAVWGLHHNETNTDALTVTLDLDEGTYLLQTDISGDHSQGTCRRIFAETS